MRIITTRKVDELGRIILPLELRNELNIRNGTIVDVCIDDKKDIVIRVSKPMCSLCGSYDNLVKVADNQICRECQKVIKNS